MKPIAQKTEKKTEEYNSEKSSKLKKIINI